MPPKQQASKKTIDKAKAKIIEDKTFGLKNKKGTKNQKFIAQVQNQVQNAGKSAREIAKLQEEKEKRKEEKKKADLELLTLFKPVIGQQLLAAGTDPKSVLCMYFKQGSCTKGAKCKFSHDLAVERKAEKRSLYDDINGSGNKENETMANWDDAELADVVEKRHGEDNRKKNATQIVCKFFLEAVENNTYGWFWTCQNGAACQYKHALPPGFMLKRDRKLLDEQKETISLEDLIESERAALGGCVTKVTLESFLAWKKRKIEEKKLQLVKDEEKKRNDFVKHGRLLGLSGREMFTFNPELIANDDEDADNDIDYKHRSDDESEDEDDDEEHNETDGQATASAIRKPAIRDLNDIDLLANEAREVDNTGTIATDDRFDNFRKLEREKQERRQAAAAQAALVEQANNLDHASGSDTASACASATTYNDTTSTVNNDEDEDETEGVQIDEDLFGDDLDDVEEQLRETNLTS
ncbi:unnamed protein product [Rotaria magnacalcarata]|uniref:C3H1-type domain-containing protein n=3 Tax=Rotaria magnacalcarata TaxID=392030 RepID=A0A816LXR9_9BILA|nr:unnamed protein product [Rotaria magnacalcarata]CAF1225195.1 unnamed protein product [Rotaria magnacalcarata]CAF1916106.1 unnamed protein product [Rotaria magnacalcarata]CAF1934690.1 unnamed protein product [Rotaria magnacalcarata]CAF1947908.1 unnamed protein product [Rotaria magnacalcarata]